MRQGYLEMEVVLEALHSSSHPGFGCRPGNSSAVRYIVPRAGWNIPWWIVYITRPLSVLSFISAIIPLCELSGQPHVRKSVVQIKP